jgi:hypothetical protein
MIYKIVFTLAAALFLGLAQPYPPPPEGTLTPDASETAIPPPATLAPDIATPYPDFTPADPTMPTDLSPPTGTDHPRLIGSGHQQDNGNGAPAAAQSGTSPNAAGNLLFLWVAFLAALTMFIAGIAASILLFSRRHIGGK